MQLKYQYQVNHKGHLVGEWITFPISWWTDKWTNKWMWRYKLMFYKFPMSEQILDYDFYAVRCVGFNISCILWFPNYRKNVKSFQYRMVRTQGALISIKENQGKVKTGKVKISPMGKCMDMFWNYALNE